MSDVDAEAHAAFADQRLSAISRVRTVDRDKLTAGATAFLATRLLASVEDKRFTQAEQKTLSAFLMYCVRRRGIAHS